MKPTVLQFVGYDRDGGGILRVMRTLAATGRFRSMVGVGRRFRWNEPVPALHVWRGPEMEAERISPATLLRSFAVARRVRRWLRRGGGRVFHGRSRAGLLVALWLRAMGATRVVASVHCFGRQRWFYRCAAWVLGRRLFWLGPAMKRYYGIAGDGWENCVPDAVAEDALERRARAAGDAGELRIGCVGALVAVKQWDLVLRALALLPREMAARVVHAGAEDGTEESAKVAQELRRLAEAEGVANRATWLGDVAAMGDFYAAIDVLVVASRWEASSVAALEALAAGVPVLAADAAGTRDLVEFTGGGAVFRSDDPADLARQLIELRNRLAAGGGKVESRRLERFRAGKVAREWEAIYREFGA